MIKLFQPPRNRSSNGITETLPAPLGASVYADRDGENSAEIIVYQEGTACIQTAQLTGAGY